MEFNSPALLAQVARVVTANLSRLGRSKDDILQDLRLIRFDDQGVIGLIDAVIAGQRPDKKEVQNKLTDFNDHQWHVARAAERLATETGPVSKLSRDELQLISWGKVDIRRQVQDAMNLWGRGRFSPNVENLKKIRAGIEDLNAAIDDIEHVLIHGK